MNRVVEGYGLESVVFLMGLIGNKHHKHPLEELVDYG